jgi:hypothetical protein
MKQYGFKKRHYLILIFFMAIFVLSTRYIDQNKSEWVKQVTQEESES